MWQYTTRAWCADCLMNQNIKNSLTTRTSICRTDQRLQPLLRTVTLIRIQETETITSSLVNYQLIYYGYANRKRKRENEKDNELGSSIVRNHDVCEPRHSLVPDPILWLYKLLKYRARLSPATQRKSLGQMLFFSLPTQLIITPPLNILNATLDENCQLHIYANACGVSRYSLDREVKISPLPEIPSQNHHVLLARRLLTARIIPYSKLG